jgi:hypothetical protein
MKHKKIDKKLLLSKKTIANLGDSHMDALRGGETVLTCPTHLTDCNTRCASNCTICEETARTC